jgi:hypothetical protein
MDSFKPRRRRNPESNLTDEIREALVLDGWHTEKIHGSAMQEGLPDLYITKALRGGGRLNKWLEIKMPTRRGNVFTNAQLEKFPVLSRNGTQIYVVDDVTKLPLIYGDPNWYKYLQYIRR